MRGSKGLSVSFVNGCFDVLHPGHIALLEFAKSKADKLVVGIDSDKKIRITKPGRPVFTQWERKYMLESIRFVDDVWVFDSAESLDKLVEYISPDIMVIGSDWKGKEVVGSQYAAELIFFERIGEFSTTKILESLGGR